LLCPAATQVRNEVKNTHTQSINLKNHYSGKKKAKCRLDHPLFILYLFVSSLEDKDHCKEKGSISAPCQLFCKPFLRCGLCSHTPTNFVR
jgi:hypothetical protein